MNRMIVAVALAGAALLAAGSEAATMNFECPAPAAAVGQPPELAGQWDMVMDVGGTPSFGLISLGRSETKLAGSIALNAGVAVVRSLTLDGQAVAMIVATGEGEVRFDGSLAADGKRMCGVVTYHGGRKYQMVAQKRPDRVSPRSN